MSLWLGLVDENICGKAMGNPCWPRIRSEARSCLLLGAFGAAMHVRWTWRWCVKDNRQWGYHGIHCGKRLHNELERSTMLLMGKSTISMAISNSELLNYQRVYHQQYIQYVAFGCVWKCLKMIIPQYTPPNCYLDTSGNLTMVVAQTAPPSMRIGWSSVHPILEPVLSGVWKFGCTPQFLAC